MAFVGPSAARLIAPMQDIEELPEDGTSAGSELPGAPPASAG
jgi:hypothetical protein